jgi:hypothetical protein
LDWILPREKGKSNEWAEDRVLGTCTLMEQLEEVIRRRGIDQALI